MSYHIMDDEELASTQSMLDDMKLERGAKHFGHEGIDLSDEKGLGYCDECAEYFTV